MWTLPRFLIRSLGHLVAVALSRGGAGVNFPAVSAVGPCRVCIGCLAVEMCASLRLWLFIDIVSVHRRVDTGVCVCVRCPLSGVLDFLSGCFCTFTDLQDVLQEFGYEPFVGWYLLQISSFFGAYFFILLKLSFECLKKDVFCCQRFSILIFLILSVFSFMVRTFSLLT